MENIPSVLKLGILSNERAESVPHYSIAHEMIQERRDLKRVPGDWVRFLHPSQEAVLDYDAIFAMDWRHPNQFGYFGRRSKKCAEILVPNLVEPRFLTGAYVVDDAAKVKLDSLAFGLPVTINPGLFFR